MKSNFLSLPFEALHSLGPYPTSHPSVSCTSSLYTPLFPPKHTLCCPPSTFCIFHPLPVPFPLLGMPFLASAFSLYYSPVQPPPRACRSGSCINHGAYNLYPRAFNTSSPWTLTKGGSNFLLWSQEAGAGTPGVLSMVLRATPRLSITQNKRCCMNQW